LTGYAGRATIFTMQHEPSTAASAARRPAPARLPAVFLAVSVAAHAIVFGVLPQFTRDQSPPPAALEVVIAKPQPLPVAPPAPEQPPPPRRQPEPQRTRVPPPVAPSAPQPEPPPPILALPSTQAPAESTFTVPAPKPVEPPRAPEQKAQVASVAVTPPVFNASYLRNPAPHYPLAARRTGEQGTATVRVLVTAEGLPARVELEKSSGSMHLDNAAIEAVKGWRFKPAQRGTEPVEGWVLVPIVFRLEG
jgi:periplasmic protein TonB